VCVVISHDPDYGDRASYRNTGIFISPDMTVSLRTILRLQLYLELWLFAWIHAPYHIPNIEPQRYCHIYTVCLLLCMGVMVVKTTHRNCIRVMVVHVFESSSPLLLEYILNSKLRLYVV
jgi:hypothetical protein